jgi:hypothetical protein
MLSYIRKLENENPERVEDLRRKARREEENANILTIKELNNLKYDTYFK